MKEVTSQNRKSTEKSTKFGAKLNFAAAEAYKLLRTNLFFSVPEESSGRVIGITSSVRGEGKSTTSFNLSCALAESGKNTLLIECDMRLPVLAKNLNINRDPGMSNLIVGMCDTSDVIRDSGIHEKLKLITAGNIPPNPSELLGSERFRKIVERLTEGFDYIILDLPPVTAVSDALVVANIADGLIVVVRQDVCTRSALAETMRQLSIVDDKIIGFVFSCAHSNVSRYYKKYKKYRKGYGYGYGGYYQAPTNKDDD